MHYKNGRLVNIGDWVVGISHNSDNKPICGYVVEMMPKQGPCNIKIHVWEDERIYEDGCDTHTISCVNSRGKDDFGDAAKFIKVEDGLRMINAVVDYGKYNSSYSPLGS